MRLIITRHGETEHNVAGMITGHSHGKLTKKGLMQAELLARRLADEKIDIIYSSDLRRAADTADVIARFHPGIPVVLTEELRERDYGKAEGVRKADIGMDSKKSVTFMEFEGAEKPKEMYMRAKSFLEDIAGKHQKETVLLVMHNGILKTSIAAIEKRPLEELEKVDFIDNCSVTVYDIDEKGNASLELMNCTRHLG